MVDITYSAKAAPGSSLPTQHTIGKPKKAKPANPKKPIKAEPRPDVYTVFYMST